MYTMTESTRVTYSTVCMVQEILHCVMGLCEGLAEDFGESADGCVIVRSVGLEFPEGGGEGVRFEGVWLGWVEGVCRDRR